MARHRLRRHRGRAEDERRPTCIARKYPEFHGIQGGVPGLPSVGLPSNLKTAFIEIEYDRDLFDPEKGFSKKAATIRTHLKTVHMIISGVLDRMPDKDYEPIRGVRSTNLELSFQVGEPLDTISVGGVTLGQGRHVINKNTA